MMMTPALRRFSLTAHVSTSVGWFGAVASFLALAVAGLVSRDPQLVTASYTAMQATGWWVIVPLALAALPTGLLMSLGTEWGLFRHYWIVAKLAITIVATLLLLLHMQPVGHLARVVTETTLASGELAGLRLQLVANAGAALVALLVATGLSIYKPRGLTPYGRRRQLQGADGREHAARSASPPRWVTVCGVIAILIAFSVVVLHLTGRGMGGH